MHVPRDNNRVDGYNPRTQGFDPKNFNHVDRVDIDSHSGWDPSLVRPTFAKS